MKKLQLSKMTLRSLSPEGLKQVVGGNTGVGNSTECYCTAQCSAREQYCTGEGDSCPSETGVCTDATPQGDCWIPDTSEFECGS
jgi:hypothetical protein